MGEKAGPRIIVVMASIIAAVSGCGTNASNASGTTPSPATTASARASTVASAMVGGIAHGGFNPDFVSCALRGSLPGLVFHGTLSGPNIGVDKFVVTAGQPSNGRTPTSPDDGIFALKYPGQGPSGPFTCTLTAVDTPTGITLAPHQSSDWTLTVS